MGGLNTEIEHKGTSLYIQTQDKGLKAQYVETLVYATGKLLVSRKTSYTQYLDSHNLGEKIKKIIKEQHKKILQEMSEGKFDHFLTSEKKSESS